MIDMKTAWKTWAWHSAFAVMILFGIDLLAPIAYPIFGVEYGGIWEAWRTDAAFWFLRELDQFFRKVGKLWGEGSVWSLPGRVWESIDRLDAIGDFVAPWLVTLFIVVRWLA